MIWNRIWYPIKQGILGIFRNRLFSLASVVTIAACIFVFGIFYSLVQNIEELARHAEETIGITVFFQEGTGEDEILRIAEELRGEKGVLKVDYISPEEAWENYKEKYFSENPELAAGFEGDNPLISSASLEIRLSDAAEQDRLVKEIGGMDMVRKVNHSAEVARGLASVNLLISSVSVSITVLLFVVSLLLISNTVVLSINARKDEIEIIKWIGATDAFVRTPFLVEGTVIALVGSAIPLGLLYVIYLVGIRLIRQRFGVLSSSLQFLPAGEIFRVLIPAALCMGLIIGLAGSTLSIRKHLKV